MHCNKKAAVKIFESRDNPNKLYYYCRYDECSFFRFWYPSEYDFNGSALFVEGENVENATNYLLIELKMLIEEVNANVKSLRNICDKANGGWTTTFKYTTMFMVFIYLFATSMRR